MEHGGLLRGTTLSSKRIVSYTTTRESGVVREQLVEVNHDCSFQPACAYERQEPVDESREPVLEPCHEGDVHDEPDEPRYSAREPHPVRAEDGGATVHGSHAPEVPVLPRSRIGTVSDAISDDMGGMETGLKSNLRNARQIVIVHHVADYEYLRVPGK